MAEEVIDIDLKDPEVEKAALKIQAHFKGFKCSKMSTPTNPPNKDHPQTTKSEAMPKANVSWTQLKHSRDVIVL